MLVFRIVTRKQVATALTGEGARRYGGRWNFKGAAVVYTAGTGALALLEMLVQDQPLRAEYTVLPVELPPSIEVAHISLDRLPKNWPESGDLEPTRAIGAQWLHEAKTAVLRVPSAVVPSEFNYLLNPAHSKFVRIRIGRVEKLSIDLRLIQRFATNKSTA